MEVVKGWTGQQVVYSAEGSAPCINHGGNEMLLPYKRKWDVNGLNNNSIGYGKKQHKRERGQGQSHQVYDPSSSRITGMQRKKKRKTRRNGFARMRRMHVPRTVPRAPYNDSSFLIKVRRAGGLAALVSPATFSTVKTTTSDEDARASCYREEEILEPVTELGVGNGYGSMTGLIHLRATDDGSSYSTVDEIDIDSVQQQQQQQGDSSFSQLDSVRRLEQRLDRDVSRFEMTLPSPSDVQSRRAPESLEERIARQDRDIALLEDENLTLKERLSLMQQAVYEYQERLARMSQGEVDQLPAECSNHGSSD
ncbi:hypothetical protein CY35_01G113500 [Sphagnum magellanicum]|nr:hypothetical protein CY35_01G113500 [Sphagnum magellanicum]KAH9575493.1 hypothetical protein CY35_01G113500 [Sphagnum magellanicum]KAH9575494.1 hypothetical protein CY35_01G113500 [Sphagnum magellanicum]KAH9575495.1 hypothetical protein CY35_01G113500 [Sphagnum magellanicum]KAH9575496.1 hypothetical protein CY35_01G113500 [Sphagnum magellanicum]